MLELLILNKQNKKQILLIENDKIIEYYDDENTELRNEGNIFIGIVKNILKGMEAAFVDIGTEKNSYIQLSDVLPKVDETKNNKKQVKKVSINKLLKPNDRILVQVKKDSNRLKGARISTHINIPSKYIALMPNTDIITVSQKIEDKEEQQRLIKIVKENISPKNGAIIRTSAKGKTQELIDDLKFVEEKWNNINKEYEENKNKKARLIYKGQDIVQKLLQDLTGKNLQKIISNDKNDIKRLKKYLEGQKEYSKIKFEFKSSKDIEQLYNVDAQLEKILKRKVWLKCGGFITIDKTEALTAIDVNTGKMTEGKSFNEIVYKVNEQATHEIAKQIRLRDIGGIIIIDYIDMDKESDKEKIAELLKKCLKEDRAKTQVEGFTKLDLMELTRKHICSHNS